MSPTTKSRRITPGWFPTKDQPYAGLVYMAVLYHDDHGYYMMKRKYGFRFCIKSVQRFDKTKHKRINKVYWLGQLMWGKVDLDFDVGFTIQEYINTTKKQVASEVNHVKPILSFPHYIRSHFKEFQFNHMPPTQQEIEKWQVFYSLNK